MDDRSILIVVLAVAATAVIYGIVLVWRARQDAGPRRPASAPGAGAATPSAGCSAIEAVAHLRRLGFFATEAAAGDADLARRLEQAIEEEWGAPIEDLARSSQQLDVLLALCDPRRAYRAPDEYFYPGDDTFLEIIGRCAQLEGAAPGTPLREEWAGEQGPVEVHFAVDGRAASYTVEDPKYIDPGMFAALNAAAPGGARRLRVTDVLGMPNVVLALTDAEGEALMRQRGWTFHPAVP